MIGDGDDGKRGRMGMETNLMGMGTNTHPHAALYYSGNGTVSLNGYILKGSLLEP